MALDYSRKNLRGYSFKGKDEDLIGANFSGAILIGADFSGVTLIGATFIDADIRSADFSNANLTGVNFSHAKAGLQRRWVFFLVLVSWVLMGLSGFLSAYAGIFVADLIFQPVNGPQITYQIAGCTVLVILVIFFFVAIRQGIQAGLIAIAVAFAGVVALAGIGAFAAAFAGAYAGAGVGAFIFAVAGAFAGAFTVTFAGAFVGAFAGAFAGAVAGVLAGAGAFAFAFAGAIVVALTQAVGGTGIVAVILAVAVAVLLLSIYISLRALEENSKHTLIFDIAVVFAAIGGTSFRVADLTDANFTEAILKSTDFRKATLTRTCFYKTKKLERVRPGSSYLQIPKVRKVFLTGDGQDKNFERENLRGINFKGANLKDANFSGTDLSEANLQDADLSGAKLVQTQLDNTDLTGATLTGVIIEDWNITSHTKLHGVRCEYVYMRLPTKDNLDPLRKPDNLKEVFADGEFEDFIQPIFDTLDLYHNHGVDPRAIAAAFKELAENNPEAELEIIAIERRGEDKILLRVKTVVTANKSELSKEYLIKYNQLKELAEQDFKLLIAEKELQIRALTNMVDTMLKIPNIYIEKQGGTIMTGERNINTGGGNYNEQIQGNYVQGNYYTSADKQSLADAAIEIQQLLYQLSLTNTTTNEAVTETIYQEIRRNSPLKARLQFAIKAGGLEALKAIFNHPLFSIPAETIKGWLEAEY